MQTTLEKRIDDEIDEQDLVDESGETCPECGSDFIVVNGHCKTCFECGFSLCGI